MTLPLSSVWIAYCTGCGVMFSDTTSYMREIPALLIEHRQLKCARCESAPIKAAEFAPTGRKTP